MNKLKNIIEQFQSYCSIQELPKHFGVEELLENEYHSGNWNDHALTLTDEQRRKLNQFETQILKARANHHYQVYLYHLKYTEGRVNGD